VAAYVDDGVATYVDDDVATYMDDDMAAYVGVDFLLLSHLLLPINDFGKRLISSPKSFQQIKI
jgi:hypothetical protein